MGWCGDSTYPAVTRRAKRRAWAGRTWAGLPRNSDQALNHSSAAAHILPVDIHKSHNPTRRAAAAAAEAASDKQTIRVARPRCTFCNYYSPCNNIFHIFSNIVLRILHVLHTVHIFFKYFSYFQCIICKTKYIITYCNIQYLFIAHLCVDDQINCINVHIRNPDQQDQIR